MRLLQISSTHHDSCGIGTHSVSLERAVRHLGGEIRTTTELSTADGDDVVLVQHEWGLIPDADLRDYCAKSPVPVIMFAHAGGVEIFSEDVDGFIAMHPDIVQSLPGPSLAIPHPAWLPNVLEERSQLRTRFGLNDKSFVVGSSGFMTGFRQFPTIVTRLLPLVRAHGGFIELVTPAVSGPWHPDERIEAELGWLHKEHSDHFRYDTRYHATDELNLRLQACDLLWCFTNRASSAYASGTAADQYASGTAMVLSDIEQHHHILRKDGMISAPADIDGFTDTLLQAVEERRFARHDPTTFSWLDAARMIIDFCQRCALR
jgi:hypothetical protein